MTDDLLEAEKESIGIKVPSMRFARCANAEQVLVAADKQLSLTDGRAAGGRFLQVVFHTIFSVALHFTGTFFSVLEPSPRGPRQPGQFSACSCSARTRRKAMVRMRESVDLV